MFLNADKNIRLRFLRFLQRNTKQIRFLHNFFNGNFLIIQAEHNFQRIRFNFEAIAFLQSPFDRKTGVEKQEFQIKTQFLRKNCSIDKPDHYNFPHRPEILLSFRCHFIFHRSPWYDHL